MEFESFVKKIHAAEIAGVLNKGKLAEAIYKLVEEKTKFLKNTPGHPTKEMSEMKKQLLASEESYQLLAREFDDQKKITQDMNKKIGELEKFINETKGLKLKPGQQQLNS